MALVINSPVKLAHDNYQIGVHQMERLLECERLKIWLDNENRHDLEKISELEKIKLKQYVSQTAGLIKSYCNPDIELVSREILDSIFTFP